MNNYSITKAATPEVVCGKLAESLCKDVLNDADFTALGLDLFKDFVFSYESHDLYFWHRFWSCSPYDLLDLAEQPLLAIRPLQSDKDRRKTVFFNKKGGTSYIFMQAEILRGWHHGTIEVQAYYTHMHVWHFKVRVPYLTENGRTTAPCFTFNTTERTFKCVKGRCRYNDAVWSSYDDIDWSVLPPCFKAFAYKVTHL